MNDVLQGRLTISRVTGDESFARIRLTNEQRDVVVEINVAPEALALALLGLASQPCTYKRYGDLKRG